MQKIAIVPDRLLPESPHWQVCKRAIIKTFLVMRLTIFLLTAAFMHVHATSTAQSVTISGKDLTLKQVFATIEKQTGYVLFANESYLLDAKKISANIQNMPLKDALDLILRDQPLEYMLKNKTIILGKRLISFPRIIMAQPPVVTGIVRDSTGAPLRSVTVVNRTTKKVTQTNAAGEFSIEAGVDDVLSFTSIGFEPQILSVRENSVNIMLRRSRSTLDEIQVIAYGTTTRRFNTGSVSVVTSDEIARQPVPNPLQALQGRVPGLFITQGNGVTGSQMTVSIRGQVSIASGKMPLYIIDGVPFNETPINTLGGSTYSSGGAAGLIDPMNSVNPADIESISVLKDADATSIYGSRGANGVILITTKKGRAGDTRFSVNAYTGGGKVTRMMPMLGLSDYLKMRRTAFANDNVTPNATNAPDLTVWDTTKYTDYQKQFIGNTANQTEVNASFSGGDQHLRYLFSSTYHKESTVFPGDFGYNRFASHLNVENTSMNGKFSIGVSAFYTREKNNLGFSDMTSVTYALPPNYPLYLPNGNLNWAGGVTNPMSYLLQQYNFKSENFLANANLRYTILPGLNARVSLGYNKMTQSYDMLTPIISANPSNNPQSRGTYSQNYVQSYIIEPQLDYMKNIADGRLSVTVGGTWQLSNFAQPYYIVASGFPNDQLLGSWISATTINLKTNSYTDYKYASLFGRANYVWKERYLLNLTARRDGSSRFGPNRQWGNFGSVGAGWIFTNEAFMNAASSWLSFGKLRASYGSVGNDQIRDYGYLASYGSVFYTYESAGIYPLRVANPDYGWESTRKKEAALELGFLKDRILLTTAWFASRTDNQLISTPLSTQSGFSSYQSNFPALVESRGWEWELRTVNIKKKNFSWNSSFNLTIPRNELVSFPNLDKTVYAGIYVVGKPISTINGYHYTGVVNGVPTVEDVDKNGSISAGLSEKNRGDYRILGIATPKYYGGLNNTLRYKNLQLDFLLQFVKQSKSNIRAATAQPGAMRNQDEDILKEGIKPSVTVGSPVNVGYNNYMYSDAVLMSDASYIRLKNISLTYDLPATWQKAAKLKDAGVFVRGQNLVTVTNYLGFDPETAGTALPPLKMIVAGLRCSL